MSSPVMSLRGVSVASEHPRGSGKGVYVAGSSWGLDTAPS